jgi:CRP-like cAMP-binding protein
MPGNPSANRTANRILARLPREDFDLLEPNLEALDLPVKKMLETRKRRIDHVYFIESGFASVVAEGGSKPSIEVGLIGREGMTGLSVVLGSDRAAHETFIQAAGTGLRISAKNLRDADSRSISLHRAMWRYALSYLLQTTSTALANGRSNMEERLARWLLMAQDRLENDEVPLTHEFLSLMLGTYRPGVTKAIQVLEREDLIVARRGGIRIVDRKGLEKRSNGTYLSLNS